MAISRQDIDRQLQEMALTNWEEFKRLTGVDTTNFIICSKRKEGKSIRQIALIVSRNRDKVHRVCKICP